MPVTELVNYGLDGAKAPPILQYKGTHLEPLQYHEKIAESNTVIIDVRNHYEAAIGHFEPPPPGSGDKKKSSTDDSDSPPPGWMIQRRNNSCKASKY
jgi:hypothetical protein